MNKVSTLYDFPVELVSIYTKEEENATSPDDFVQTPNRMAVQRQDNGVVLGVVSDKYKILPHAQVVDGFRAAFGGENIVETIRVTRGGARLQYEAILPSVTVEVRPGDHMQLRIIAVNSYDGTHVLQATFGAFRLICSNGAMTGKSFVNMQQRHVGAIGIKVDSLQTNIAILTENFRKQLPVFQHMANTSSGIGVETFRGEAFSEEAVALPEYLLAAAYDEFVRAKDDTKWGYYNALTFAITHKMRRESPEAQLRYGRVAWEAAQAL